MDNTPCIHHEVISSSDKGMGEEIGTCSKCGQVKRYYWENSKDFRMWRRAEILAPGGNEVPKIKMGPFRKLSNKRLQELYEIGPQLFGNKYHYFPKHRESITRIYQKHQDELKVTAKVEPAPAGASLAETPPEEISQIEPLTPFEVETEAIIEGLNKELEKRERRMNALGISTEKIKMEIVAYGTALAIYRSRYRSPN